MAAGLRPQYGASHSVVALTISLIRFLGAEPPGQSFHTPPSRMQRTLPPNRTYSHILAEAQVKGKIIDEPCNSA